MITVILASHNGARTLPRMLEALCALNEPTGGWKLVVVDNASHDATPEILAGYQARLPMTHLYHEVRGKNRALNVALDYIEGELVVFTDDDVLPEKNWLTALTQAAERNPAYDLFGGAILPDWPTPTPYWILNHVPLGITYALTEPSLQEGEINPGLIWGPNMMVRAHIFHQGHRFDESVGPASGEYIMGSETEFNRRIAAAGHKCWFTPAVKVRHIIRSEQMSRKWILRRAYRFGKNMYVQNGAKNSVSFPRLFGVPRWMLSKIALKALESLWRGALWRSERSFEALWEVWHLHGYLIQARKDLRHRSN